MFDWKEIPRPIIGLSPMADMTDTPFNLMCKKHGASVIFKEMVSAEAVVRGNEKTIRMAMNTAEERPIIQQIFGSNPITMAEAARILVERHEPDAIDINMGCPVYKIVSNFDGAALMKDADRAAKIVRSVKRAISVPVSVKIRLGWDNDVECIAFAAMLEEAGADAISVHGRTRVQKYSGKANWERIGEVKSAVTIPVLANGDIVDVASAQAALHVTKADGCLIGRGALGNPWIFESIRRGVDLQPSVSERIKTMLEHAHLQVAQYGQRGLRKLRKHLPFYVRGVAQTSTIRQQLVRVETMEELRGILQELQP